MTDMNKLYFKNLIADLLHHKIFTGACMIFCAALCVFAGYDKVSDKEKLAEYNSCLEEYDKVIADVEQSLSLASDQVAEMQEYVDKSIFMQLDAQNIQSASVQYAINTEANLGNIFNALIYYVNEGGLRESLGDEYPQLDVKYWKDVVGCATGGNVFSITVSHYDAEKTKAMLDVIKQRLTNQVPVIAQTEGDFTFTEISTSYYVRADVNVTNAQINHLNTLKGYVSNRADFTNRLISSQSGKASYMENNMPVLLGTDTPGAVVTVLIYLAVGLLLGLAIPMAGFSLRNALQKRIRSDEDMDAFSLHTIGCCHTEANQTDALQRGLVEFTHFKESHNLPAIYFNILSDDSRTKETVDNYRILLEQHDFPVKTGSQLQKDAIELQEMLDVGACVLVVQIGKTTYSQIEKQKELCNTFHIEILGCVVVA